MAIKKKIHPIARQMGYSSNEDFYNDFPTQEAFEQYAKGGMVGKKYADGGDIKGKKANTVQNFPAQPEEFVGGPMFQDPANPYPGIPRDLAARLMQMDLVQPPPQPRAITDTMNPLDGRNMPRKKLAGGGTPGLTPADKDNWNAYHSWMANTNPNYGSDALNHNAQGQTSIQQWNAGNPKQAINRPIQDYQKEFTTTPLGRSKVDNYGASGNQESGQQTSASSFKQYEYVHLDKNGNQYPGTAGDYKAGTEPLTQAQVNDWSQYGQKNSWQSNNQGIPMPAPQAPWTPQPAQPVNVGQAIAGNQMRTNDNTGKYDNMYTSGPATDYSVDAVRGDDQDYGKGGKIHIKKANKGKFTDYKERTGKTTEEALHSKDPHVRQMANFARNAAKWKHGDGGRIKRMGTGDIVSPTDPMGGATQIGMTPTGGPDGGYWQNPQATPSPPMPSQQGSYQDNINSFQMDPGPSQSSPDQPQQVTQRNQGHIGAGLTLNTAPLIGALDGLVSMRNNAQIRASEANQARSAAQRVNGKNDFIGGDMLTYAQGGMVDNYTTAPGQANEMIEGGEGVQFPNGQFDVAQGDSHNDPSGGIPTALPPESRVYSDRLKADKDFASDLVGNKIRKKHTIAELSKRFDSKVEDKTLADPSSDPIAKRTAQINKSIKTDKLDQLFQYQEMMKDPMAHVQQAMGFGGRVMADGGDTGSDYAPFDYMWKNGLPQSQGYTGQYGMNTQGYQKYANENGAGLNVDGKFGVNTMNWERPQTSGGSPDWSVPSSPYSAPSTDNSINFPNAPYSTPGDAPKDIPMDDYMKLRPYAPTNVLPAKAAAIAKKNGFNFTTGEAGVPGIIPGLMGAINAISDFPINVDKYQPDYLSRPEELNIDPILNRNLAVAKAGMSGNSGNASVDQARALGALGQTQEADNSAYMQKFNVDAAAKQDWRKTNLGIRNQADQINLQRQDALWDKMTQRESNKRQAFQEIANNAYTTSRQKLLDKHSQELIGEMFPNYDYTPGQGMTFVPDGNGGFHPVALNSSANPLAKSELKPKKKKKTTTDDDAA